MQFHFEVEKFLQKGHCDKLIESCEGKKENPMTESFFKNQLRIQFEDREIQELLQQELDNSDDPFINTFKISKLFTYVRYNNDGNVHEHRDQYIEKNVKYTFLLYLNDDYKNGETYLYLDKVNKTVIRNKTGKLIIFEGSKILHGSHPVIGVKNILISTVSY